MKGRRRRFWASGRAVLCFGVIALAGACDKSDDLRSALESHRTNWVQRVSALQDRASGLEQRLKAQPPGGNATIAAQAERRRLEASIAGSRQTLFDMQTHVTDSVREVETALRQGSAQAEETLNGVVGRMNEYVRLEEQTLAVNEAALTRIGEDVRP